VTARDDLRRASVRVSGFGMSQYFTELNKRLARVGTVGSSLKNSVCSNMVKNISVLSVLNDEASMANSGVVGNTIKLVGEILVPGASLLVDGDIKTGFGHLVVGLAARALLGPLRTRCGEIKFVRTISQ
jgi:hypothetical protein